MTRRVAERRKNHRIDSDTEQPKVDLGGEATPAMLKNISTSGLACVTQQPYQEMTMVEMSVQLPALPEEDRDYYPLECKGAVVRCEPVTRGNSRRKWIIAIFFTELDEKNKSILERYIKTRTTTPTT